MRFSAKDDIVSLTPLNPFDRFDNGRPRVPEALLEQLKHVTKNIVTEAWGILHKQGYEFQFAGDWVNLHPDRVMVGRALTATYAPLRPDLNDVVNAQGKVENRPRRHNYWLIDSVVKGDVIVADMLGLTKEIFTGDDLVAGVVGQGGAGLVIDGGIRDAVGISELPINIFCRGFDPNAIADHSIISLNGPTRIGRATVLPGDVVVGTLEGVIFIPPHLVEEVIAKAKYIHSLDDWRRIRLLEGTYRARQIHGVAFGGSDMVGHPETPAAAPEIDRDFQEWKKYQD